MVGALTPRTLAEALAIRKADPVIPFAGGTDLMVKRRSWSGTRPSFENPVLFLGEIEELKTIDLGEDYLRIGAAATLTAVLKDKATPEILQRAVLEMASPAIRNAGTLGGNICNASPAADALPPLYALGATVLLQSVAGSREIPIAEFITGPGKTVLAEDELLVAIQIPTTGFDRFYYRKVGTRKADALSKVSFAGLAKIHGESLEEIRIAIGAVAPRVVWNPEAENLLKGKKVDDLPKLAADVMTIYEKEIRPIDDQRSSADYRRKVAIRLIGDFLRSI